MLFQPYDEKNYGMTAPTEGFCYNVCLFAVGYITADQKFGN